MAQKRAPYVSLKKYGLPDISMPAIRRYARQVADRFKPDKIILFGSFAYGEPNEHSDVDLLVVMPCPNEFTQALRIQNALEAPFALDLIVRTPQRLHQRIKDEDWFLREINEKGKTLYEKPHARMAAKSRSRPALRQKVVKRTTART
jgi:predicted nucleotidyltransferase